MASSTINAQAFRILIAEDDLDVADLLALLLEDQGHEVKVAADGQLAVEALQGGEFDLLICDLWMPRMDGLAVLDWCQSNCPELPVAVLTAQRESRHAVDQRPNVHAWLLKPFSLAHQAELDQLIRSLKDRNSA